MANYNPSFLGGASLGVSKSAKNRDGKLPRELACLTTQPSQSNKAAVQKAVHFVGQECRVAQEYQLKSLKRGESMLVCALGPVSDADFTRTMIDALNHFAAEYGLPKASSYSFTAPVSGWIAGEGNPKSLTSLQRTRADVERQSSLTPTSSPRGSREQQSKTPPSSSTMKKKLNTPKNYGEPMNRFDIFYGP